MNLSQRRGVMKKTAKNTVCLWYDGGAEDAAQIIGINERIAI